MSTSTEIRKIFKDLQNESISIAEAEQSIIDFWEKWEKTSTECICTYMTTGVHSDNCPQRLFY